IENLPTPGGSVIAVAVAKGKESPVSANKTLNFSGYEWKVRSATSERGGTPNLYDPANAWTDADGALHLRIARQGERWTCAEVQLTRSLGYGSYMFVVRDSSQLEPAAVLGMLLWDNAAISQNHREIDIEITRWGDPASKNAQYAIQPYYVPANVARFTAPAGLLTHSFRWEPGQVAFRTVRGNAVNSATRGVASHVFTSGVPVPGGEIVHLNLYVYGSATKPLQNEVEVILEKFEFLP
ncbi:MAG TPA: glycoside hydrolase family 16 protein, partial [Roseiflexaceae bacterium]|nr:glycoside hydrolase family 16 protein [Roseiflexaceae bacterium]